MVRVRNVPELSSRDKQRVSEKFAEWRYEAAARTHGFLEDSLVEKHGDRVLPMLEAVWLENHCDNFNHNHSMRYLRYDYLLAMSQVFFEDSECFELYSSLPHKTKATITNDLALSDITEDGFAGLVTALYLFKRDYFTVWSQFSMSSVQSWSRIIKDRTDLKADDVETLSSILTSLDKTGNIKPLFLTTLFLMLEEVDHGVVIEALDKAVQESPDFKSKDLVKVLDSWEELKDYPFSWAASVAKVHKRYTKGEDSL